MLQISKYKGEIWRKSNTPLIMSSYHQLQVTFLVFKVNYVSCLYTLKTQKFKTYKGLMFKIEGQSNESEIVLPAMPSP